MRFHLPSWLAAAGLAACGGSDTIRPTLLSLTGVWTYTETLNGPVPGASCNNVGTMTISHLDSGFSGSFTNTGRCTGPGGTFDGTNSGTISGGELNGTTVTFHTFCSYQGSISGSSPNQMSGTISCTNFTGTWQASR
jgi:hypothetical protein